MSTARSASAEAALPRAGRAARLRVVEALEVLERAAALEDGDERDERRAERGVEVVGREVLAHRLRLVGELVLRDVADLVLDHGLPSAIGAGLELGLQDLDPRFGGSATGASGAEVRGAVVMKGEASRPRAAADRRWPVLYR
ncbi:MAG: hypothetical protein M5U28_10630 [Sandaracinaceae bacterium]|nr:hypothetical protein [Sandaracinaceae bacterium]